MPKSGQRRRLSAGLLALLVGAAPLFYLRRLLA